jgi:hypothetical protein
MYVAATVCVCVRARARVHPRALSLEPWNVKESEAGSSALFTHSTGLRTTSWELEISCNPNKCQLLLVCYYTSSSVQHGRKVVQLQYQSTQHSRYCDTFYVTFANSYFDRATDFDFRAAAALAPLFRAVQRQQVAWSHRKSRWSKGVVLVEIEFKQEVLEQLICLLSLDKSFIWSPWT